MTGYERVYLPLGKVADTPFHIQGGRYICLSNFHSSSAEHEYNRFNPFIHVSSLQMFG